MFFLQIEGSLQLEMIFLLQTKRKHSKIQAISNGLLFIFNTLNWQNTRDMAKSAPPPNKQKHYGCCVSWTCTYIGTPEIGSHKRSHLCYLICLRHLIKSIWLTNRLFFLRKDLFFFICEQHVLLYHLISSQSFA